ncbi:MAG TPA: WecB/TagA/CpsF family glycosyltransferase [Patescibacteria group bacterium]|nr:WecB/TagA/CpsF family glycosyltransferase [Patescibacteria group bacterium]
MKILENKVNILNIQVYNFTTDEAIKRIEVLTKAGKQRFVVTPNVDHIMKLQNDAEFRQIYDNASLVLADGMPLIWASKFLGTSLKEKISGSDLFPKLCKVAAEKGYRLFFMGGRPGAALKAAEVLRDRYPDIQIVGTYSPPFGFENDREENDKIVRAIKNAKPDILFVGLGAPKQEKWIYKYRNDYQVPMSIGVGVSFEFVSGMVKRAPLWMQRVGLEWFWRLMMEPKRLWKRYLVDDPVFFWLVLKQKLGLLK